MTTTTTTTILEYSEIIITIQSNVLKEERTGKLKTSHKGGPGYLH